MIQYVLWGVSFISLWITLVWLNVIVLQSASNARMPKRLPNVTIALPCFNKAACLAKTVHSLAGLRYPKRLLQLIVVDDFSKDGTVTEARKLRRQYPGLIDLLQHPSNRGKAAAMNTALARAKGELFACLDADTRVEPDALLCLVPYFADASVGAVIGQVRVDKPRNLYERLQQVEYTLSNFIRRLWSVMSTLFVAPGGAFSVFRTTTLKKVGGFAEAGLTEDLEIALRLRAHGYDVKMEPRAITHTTVPQNWTALWRQRIRWYRGFVVNHFKYRKLFFRRSHGLLGTFQLPVNVTSVAALLLTIVLVSYGSLHNLFELLYRSITIKGYFFNHVLDFPSFKELVLGQNIQITLPLLLGVILGAYLIYLAHRHMQEKLLRNIHHVWFYFMVAPYVTAIHWISALMQEALHARRKW